jgi:hypothetical protein
MIKSNATFFSKEIYYLLALTTIVFFSFFPFALYGMSWSDTSQIFHFGNRILQGEFPYRDFEYQTGFLGIYFDSIFQRTFGQAYISSIIYRFVLKFASTICIYFILRQKSNRLISLSFCCALSLYGIDGLMITTDVPHLEGGNLNLSVLFAILFALCITASLSQDEEHLSFPHIMAGGFFLALIFGARQSEGIICLFVVFCITTLYVLRDSKRYFKQLMIPLIIGVAVGYCLQLTFLMLNHSLIPALNSLIFEASSKKNIQLHKSIIDALTGGEEFSNAISIIKTQLFPGLISVCLLVVPFYQTKNIKHSSIIRLIVASPLAFVILGKLTNTAVFYYDIPRTFFSIILLFGCLFPQRSKDLLGLSNPVFPLVLSLFLGIVWSQQISWPGRPYTFDLPLIILSVLFIVFSVKISSNLKKYLALSFLFCMVLLFSIGIFTKSIGTEGYFSKRYENTNNKIESNMTEYIKVTPLKSQVFSMLKNRIQPGETCFISGSAAVLYTLLKCENPTRLDITNSDALTQKYVDDLLLMLQNNSPKWIVDTGRFGGIDGTFIKTDFNPLIVEKLQKGLEKLAEKYKIVETAQNLPAFKSSFPVHDNIKAYRLFELIF